jgi:hypothetical protein
MPYYRQIPAPLTPVVEQGVSAPVQPVPSAGNLSQRARPKEPAIACRPVHRLQLVPVRQMPFIHNLFAVVIHVMQRYTVELQERIRNLASRRCQA